VACRVDTDPQRGLARVRAEGALDPADVFAAIVQVWREPAYQERPAVLWDLRAADPSALFFSELREVADRERAERPDPRPARMAFLVAGDLAFGMSRMVQALLAREPIEVRVFRDDEKAAWAWLEECG
jgi:hypothetical protein